ncbi:unnamed protein product [Schistosoma mattheei]|uniref:Uncharacterized protein n=1 Tax=Schistosoma mattheei TaxID=31246 RepID=A0A183Q1P8_9TREM|nr:unnamed protein product [Schistosoma mattheei]
MITFSEIDFMSGLIIAKAGDGFSTLTNKFRSRSFKHPCSNKGSQE